MKKFLVTILALIYLSTSIGATIQLHYCMDRLVDWGIGKEETNNKTCPYCGMGRTTEDKHCVKQSTGCCKDEQKQVKIEKDQKGSEPRFSLNKSILHVPIHSPFITSEGYVLSPSVIYPLTHAPPRTDPVSLFVRNRVFRI